MKTSLIDNAEKLKQIVVFIEKDFIDKVTECAITVFVNVLEKIDSLIQKDRPTDAVIIHKRSTWNRTSLGPFKVSGRQYKMRDGSYRYTTLFVKETVCQLAAEMPFRKSSEVLKRATAIGLYYRTNHRIVHGFLADSQADADGALT